MLYALHAFNYLDRTQLKEKKKKKKAEEALALFLEKLLKLMQRRT